MRKVIGMLLLAAVFALLFGWTAYASGLVEALITWGIALLISAVIIVAVWLVEG